MRNVALLFVVPAVALSMGCSGSSSMMTVDQLRPTARVVVSIQRDASFGTDPRVVVAGQGLSVDEESQIVTVTCPCHLLDSPFMEFVVGEVYESPLRLGQYRVGYPASTFSLFLPNDARYKIIRWNIDGNTWNRENTWILE